MVLSEKPLISTQLIQSLPFGVNNCYLRLTSKSNTKKQNNILFVIILPFNNIDVILANLSHTPMGCTISSRTQDLETLQSLEEVQFVYLLPYLQGITAGKNQKFKVTAVYFPALTTIVLLCIAARAELLAHQMSKHVCV